MTRPVDGQPLQMLTRLSRELDCVLAGGFLAVRGRHAYDTFVLAEPDGALHLHDKDIPTAWEQHFYRGGDDDGVRCGTLGTTVGLWRRQARELPGQVARLTGAPVAHASHVGAVSGETPLAPGVAWRTEMLGESQICDRDGTILARLSLEDGEGHVAGDVELGPPRPVDEIPDRYWIPRLTPATQAAWHSMTAHGALAYRLNHARRRFPWQALPACDLPDELEPSDPSQAPAASG